MAQRNGATIDFIWIHTGVVGGSINGMRAILVAEYAKEPRLSKAVPSVNMNAAGTEALIKVNGTSAWIDTLPVGHKDRILRTFAEGEDVERVALVANEAWAGPTIPAATRSAQ